MKKRSVYPFCLPIFFFFLPKHKPMQLLVSQRTARLRKRQIAASLSKDYSNEVIGHWPGNMWPRKQTNEIWFRFRPCTAVSVRPTDMQAWTDFSFFFFFFFISSPAVPGFQTTDIPNIWMLTQQLQNEWHTLWSKWNHPLCRLSYSYCAIEGFQQNNLMCFSNLVDNLRLSLEDSLIQRDVFVVCLFSAEKKKYIF